MKTKDIAAKYKIDQVDFERFIIDNNLPHATGMMSISVDDRKAEDYVKQFLNKSPEGQARIKEVEEEEKEKQRKRANLLAATSHILVTTGDSVDGHRIVRYSDIISGEDVILINRWASTDDNVKVLLSCSLSEIRRNAVQRLKEEAYRLGCNAVIGVDINYISLDPETVSLSGGTTYQPYVFCATASGTAVVIEKL